MSENLKDRNLRTLEERFPGISKIIEEKREDLLKKEAMRITEETAFNGEKILVAETVGRRLYFAGRRDPKAHPVNQISVLGKIVPNAPVFILGMGNIHYLEELMAQTDESVIVMLYEPLFSVFEKQLERIDFNKIFGRRTVVLILEGINEDGMESIVGTMLQGDKIPLMKYFVLPNYVELCRERVNYFLEILVKQSENYYVGLGTKMFFSPYQAENFYHNVQYIRTGYKAFQLLGAIPNDIPAFVVSAGPSLNKNINELKRAKNKSFIIAVDTAVKPLLRKGIVPDMFATLDGIKPLELVETEQAKELPLLTMVTSASAILDYHTGKKFFFDEGYNYIRKLFEMNGKRLEGFPIGGSVATLAFTLVCHLGFRKIIFVGQDLAYTDNKSHADGTFQDAMPEENTEKFIRVPGNYEKEVPTLKNLDGYRKWFGEYIEWWTKGHEATFINATEGGARIEGTTLMTLAEVIDRECVKEVDLSSCIERLEPVFDEEEQKKVLAFFQDTPRQVHKIVSLAREGKKLYQRLDKLCKKGNMDKQAYLKILKRVKQNRKKIEENPNYQLLSQSMAKAEQIIRSGQYLKRETIEEEGMELARQGIKFMELLEEYAGIMEGYTKIVFGSQDGDGGADCRKTGKAKQEET
ncbi:MAG: motility associated factor glycosyltransferase family protein [Lachnospiraceae bacterium]|nr:motility associated factor glycosyltransferase family protein [Lachnospiraceae bacterium]